MWRWPWRSRAQRERDLDEEMQLHLQMAAQERVDRGEARKSAEAAARREFGNPALIKEVIRDVWGRTAVERVAQDLRYALRTMRRSPAFTATAILSLALGIGANTAIFSLINVLMLRPLPVRDPDSLVELLSRYPGEPRMNGFAWPVYEHFRDHNHVFTDVFGISPVRFDVSDRSVDAEVLNGEYVTSTFFGALGVRPALGRLIGPEDEDAGRDSAVVVLSWPCWHSLLNQDPSVVGRRITLSGVPATIVGVAPQGFFGLRVGITPDVWAPAAMHALVPAPNGGSGPIPVGLMARLKPGVSLDQARAEMRVLDRVRVEELAQRSHDPRWRKAQIEVVPAASGFAALRDVFAQPLGALMAIVGLLLLLACTNIASMLLARAAARQREIAIRVALGASRRRLVRQVLTESVLLAATAGALGIVVAYFGAGALARAWPIDMRFVGRALLRIDVTPDVRVLLFTAGVAMLTGVLFGMAPAWNVSASTPISSLRDRGASGDPRERRLFGRVMVVAQVAVSVVLLSAAGLFIRHVSNLRNLNLGFQPESVLLVALDPTHSGLDAAQLSRRYEELVQRVQAIPGVRAATLAGVTPIEGPAASRFVDVEGFHDNPDARRRVWLNWVAPKYFETFGTPLLAGRDFTMVEDETRPKIAIINQSMARYYFGERSPLGRRVTLEGQSRPYEIVGVVADAKYDDLRQPAPRTMYLHAFQDARGLAQRLALRTSVPPSAVAADVRRVVHDTIAGVAIAKVTTLTEQVDASIRPERLMASLAGVFGAVGALLVAIGLYGLLAYSVARRVNEIGIRIALGATRRNITAMIVKGAIGLVGAGLLVGIPFAWWARRLASSLVAGLPVESAFPIVFAAAALMLVTLVATYVPTRRASRVDAMVALRHD